MTESPQGSRHSLLRGAGAMTLMTALSRVAGLVREQVRSYFLGTGMTSDAFGIASVLPNMLRRLFAEGAMTAAFIPVLAEYRSAKERAELNVFLGRFFTWLTFVVTAVTVVGIIVTPWLVHTFFPGFGEGTEKTALTIVLAQIMWPYLVLVSLAAVAQAILNSFRVFAPSAFTPVLLNLCIIGTVLFFHDRFPDPSYAFAWGFVLGGACQLAFQIPFLRGRGLSVRPRLSVGPGVKRVAKIFLPGVFAAGIYQINVLVAQFIATTLPEGAVSSLQFSLRLQELVLGMFAVSVTTVILPMMSDQIVEGDQVGFKDTLRFSSSIIAFITIPATAALMLLAIPVVRVLFEFGEFDAVSTNKTVFALMFHALGIFFIAWSRVVTQGFYAMKDLKTPMWVAAGVMVFHAGLCFALAVPLEHGGIALAGGIAAAANGAVLWWILRARVGSLGTRTMALSISKTLVATAVMSGFVYTASAWMDLGAMTSRLEMGLSLVAVVVLGLGVFIGAASVLRCEELGEVAHILATRRIRR